VKKNDKKMRLIIVIQLLIVAGFVIGTNWASQVVYITYQSYYADIFLPFSFYFLISIKGDNNRYFNTWWKKALAVFLLVATSETLQYFGIYALARVFDPIDYVMYGLGVLLAAFIDKIIFTRTFRFWV
jgi:hypothetical protein